jgi:DNA modification methylase
MLADARYLPLKDKSVNCIITSPPYWSLRKYDIPDLIWDGDEKCEHDFQEYLRPDGGGHPTESAQVGNTKNDLQRVYGYKAGFCSRCNAWRGQLGLEPTIDLYLKHLLSILDECKRVLRDDGVMFINMGDSFASSRNEPSYDMNDKVPGDCPLNDSIWNSPCDGCQAVSVLRKFYKVQSPSDVNDPTQEHKEFESGHLPTLDFLNLKQILRSSFSNLDQKQILNLSNEQFLSFLESKVLSSFDEFQKNVSNQHHEVDGPSDFGSFFGGKPLFSHNALGCKNDKELKISSSVPRKRSNCNACPYLNYTTQSQNVKAKSLCGIPERFMLAMIDRQWILRNKLIWHKPNCMPSSAKDRFTVDFESVFFFVKSRKYWFEQQYEPHGEAHLERAKYPRGTQAKSHLEQNDSMGGSFNKLPYLVNPHLVNPQGRNRRCVWTIPTQPYPESHFATFPEVLVEPMIRAGCPVGGTVLDPFCGSGTVIVVAEKLERMGVGFDLGYQELQTKRMEPIIKPWTINADPNQMSFLK